MFNKPASGLWNNLDKRQRDNQFNEGSYELADYDWLRKTDTMYMQCLSNRFSYRTKQLLIDYFKGALKPRNVILIQAIKLECLNIERTFNLVENLHVKIC
jgi:hypothetical protein